jgi:hypothetical protein
MEVPPSPRAQSDASLRDADGPPKYRFWCSFEWPMESPSRISTIALRKKFDGNVRVHLSSHSPPRPDPKLHTTKGPQPLPEPLHLTSHLASISSPPPWPARLALPSALISAAGKLSITVSTHTHPRGRGEALLRRGQTIIRCPWPTRGPTTQPGLM